MRKQLHKTKQAVQVLLVSLGLLLPLNNTSAVSTDPVAPQRKSAPAPDAQVVKDGIGWTINFFAPLDASSLKVKALDYSAMNNDGYISDPNEQEVKIIQATGSDYKTMATSFGNTLTGGFTPSILFGIIPPPFQASVSVYTGKQDEFKDYYEWAMTGYYISMHKIDISPFILPDSYGNGANPYMDEDKWDPKSDNLLKYANPDLLQRIAECTDTTQFYSLFNTYGTHIVTAANFGASYNNFAVRKRQEYESVITTTSDAALMMKLPIKKVVAKFNVDLSDSYTSQDSTAAVRSLEVNVAKALGGDVTKSADPEA